MWRFVWQEVSEILWLISMLAGLSLFSLVFAAAALAII